LLACAGIPIGSSDRRGYTGDVFVAVIEHRCKRGGFTAPGFSAPTDGIRPRSSRINLANSARSGAPMRRRSARRS
jgi:hypothetical protein